MSRWTIDTDASRFRITFQPGLPGVGMSIRGITGTFVAEVDDPRDLGVPIPRLIPLRCLSTWELHVVPAP